MKFKTKLWKRSNKSFATTIPHVALLSMDEKKDYDVEWEYDSELKKWTISMQEKGPRNPLKTPKSVLKKAKNTKQIKKTKRGGSDE